MARRRRRHRRKGRFAFLYKLMTFLLICGALVAALALFFKVESIEITGTSRYSTDEVERASGVHVGDNLYLMDKSAAVWPPSSRTGGSGSSARAASSSIPRPRTTRRSTPSLPG